MISLLRNKRKIYVCKVNRQNNLLKYDEPIKLYENYHTANSDVDVKTFGLNAYNMVRIKTDLEHSKYYHIGDAVYIDVEPPEEHDVLCKKADYVVITEPVKSLNSYEVMLKARSASK